MKVNLGVGLFNWILWARVNDPPSTPLFGVVLTKKFYPCDCGKLVGNFVISFWLFFINVHFHFIFGEGNHEQ